MGSVTLVDYGDEGEFKISLCSVEKEMTGDKAHSDKFPGHIGRRRRP